MLRACRTYISFCFSLRTHPLSPAPAARTVRFVWQTVHTVIATFIVRQFLPPQPRGRLSRQGLSFAMRLCLYQGVVSDRSWFRHSARGTHGRPRHSWTNYRNSHGTSPALKHALLLPFKDSRPPDHSQHYKKHRFARCLTPECPSRADPPESSPPRLKQLP